MEKLNYHIEKNTMMDWLLLNDMPTGEIILWQALLNIANRLGQRRVFNAPASVLMRYTGLSRRGMENARKRLVERGMIQYTKGSGNKAPVYQILPLSEAVESFTNAPHYAESYVPNCAQDYRIHRDIDREKSSSEGGHELGVLCKMYEENIGDLGPVIEEGLLSWLQEFDQEIVTEAMRITAKRGGQSFSYVEAILVDWKKAGMKTVEDATAYEAAKKVKKQRKKVIPIPQTKQKQHTEEVDLNEWAKEVFQ